MTLVRRAQQGTADAVVRGRRRRAAADDRRGAHPGRAAGHRGRRRRPDRSPTADALPPTAAPCRRAGAVPRRRRRASATRAPLIDGRARARRAGRGRRRPARADPARRRRASWAPTSPSAPPALRRAAGLRRPARRLHVACAPGLERHLPGRLVGVSVDADGAPGLPAGAADPRAAHPPREGDLQHLHRAGAARRRWPRCTPSTTAPRGCAAIARRVAPATPPRCAGALRDGGVEVVHDGVLRHRHGRGCRAGPPRSCAAAAARGVNLRLRRRRHRVGVSTDETTDRRRPRARCWRRSASPAATSTPSTPARRRAAGRRCVRDVGRTSPTRCSHATTARPRCCATCAGSSDRDYALDRGMIPLGSCTMKLNATTEMEPITWPEFADLHPFAPAEPDAEGYRELIDELERLAGRGHRLRRGVAPAQRRLAGRARRAAGDPRLPPARSGDDAPRRLPDPGQRARHQRRLRRDGRACRSSWSRPPTDGDVDLDDLRAKVEQHARRPGRDHGDLPVDARRLRGHHHRAVRARARRRRPGLRRRRQPQRAARAGPARASSAPTSPPEPAQDLLHPARRRRPGRRPGRRCARTWRRTCPTTRSHPEAGPATGRRPDPRGAVRLGGHPADLVGLRAADGRRRA